MAKPKAKSTRELKKETLADLTEKIKKARSMAFVNYHGLGANQLNQLREKIKQSGGELTIAKNTLLSRALTNSDLRPQNSELISGPTAAIFAYEDELAPIKTSAESFKTQGAGLFKFGFLGSNLLDTASLDDLAKIPPRDVLYAKMVGALNSPIYGIASVLSANLRNLVYALDQIAKQKGA